MHEWTLNFSSSLIFQGYSYQPNGYVQTGLGFEPNYGRTYATPVQRYEFQTNQMSPINQVSLQSVSFAPAVTYTSQVSTGSTPMLLSSQNDLNKTVSGNDMPGYPRVNSVPPRSLNCNGYSGDYSGNQNHNLANNVPQQQQQTQQHNQHQQQMQQQQHHQQQHNNSNQMHPPQVPQSPNRSNMSTPVSQHMMVPTGPGSNHMSQIPHSPNSLQNNGNQQQQIQMQSPNHHHSQLQTASRYPSHPGTPHSMQQSPNKNPQMLHSHSGMHTPNPQHNAHQHNMTAMSPNHNMNHVQEWSWNNHTVPAGNNEIFNQSDRVNLNTRLKTMILSKNDQKDHDHQNGDGTTSAANQQNTAQTGHFLSYSHHLRDINPTTNDSRSLQPCSAPVAEPIGGGGESIWKPFGYNKPNDFQYSDQKLENSIRKTDYSGTDEIVKEKNAKGKATAAQKSQNADVKVKTEPEKVKPKRQRKKPPPKQTPVNDASTNKSSNNENCQNSNPRQSYSSYGIDHIHPPNEPMQPSKPPYYLPKANESQTHSALTTPFDPTIKIKQEPMSFSNYNPTTNHPVENFDLAQVKMEGYERNYQNFINYADYCQSQNSTANRGAQQQQQSQSETDYPCFNPNYNYPSFSSANYQANYPNYNQYTGQQVQQQPMNVEPVPQTTKQEPYLQEQQVKTEITNENKIELTNYEKEIPVYTYPNPSKLPTVGDQNQKAETQMFPYLGEGGPATLTESTGFSCCRQGGTHHPSDEHIRDGACVGRQTKDELMLDDEAEKSQDEAGERTAIPSPDRTEKGLKPEVPDCDCFSSDKNPPEPGSYYTHLGESEFD